MTARVPAVEEFSLLRKTCSQETTGATPLLIPSANFELNRVDLKCSLYEHNEISNCEGMAVLIPLTGSSLTNDTDTQTGHCKLPTGAVFMCQLHPAVPWKGAFS